MPGALRAWFCFGHAVIGQGKHGRYSRFTDEKTGSQGMSDLVKVPQLGRGEAGFQAPESLF